MGATAYAAVISLVHLMEQIQLYHARQPIFLDEQQRQLESLHEDVTFLQDFLETYSRGDSNEGERLESRIADVAYAAEDIIESHIVDDINARSRKLAKYIFNPLSERMGKIKYDDEKEALKIKDSDHFSEGLKKIIEDMDIIKKEIANINENSKPIEDQQSIDLAHVRSPRHFPTMKNNMASFEDDVNQILDKLTTDQPNLQIIPITGMGGIGKTTLAKNIYVNPFIVQHFDVRVWITLSQEYDVREVLAGLLREIEVHVDQNELEGELGVKLHKYLSGRRYLIIMDDMWSTKAWDDLQKFLPNNNNESRVIVTTRLSNVANYMGSSNLYKMNFLDEAKSWNLFCRKVFNEENCPHPHLEDIGKQIAKSCKGLPLSISLIGGLLANSKMTRESWEYVVGDINEIINLKDDARCLKILTISYDQLPVYLKPCFLYLGSFPEDHEIRVSKLIKLWVAEGFLKPSKLESLEEVAKNYLEDLIERNLVSVSMWGTTGNLKCCKIHDLLRDLCLRKAQEERFFCVNMVQNPSVSQDLSSPPRRIVVHHQFSDTEYSFQVSRALQSAGLARSLTCNFPLGPRFTQDPVLDYRPSLKFRLLRMLNVVDDYPVEEVFQLVNSRILSLKSTQNNITLIPSSICQLWNLQTLVIVQLWIMVAPSEIWEMPQLSHVMISNGLELPDPLNRRHDCVLENIQTLSKIFNLMWTEEVLRKIPHVKKLKLEYCASNCIRYRLNNLSFLHKLQSLTCSFLKCTLMKNLEFPLSLKKLTLYYVDWSWEGINEKIGSLPNLEKLRLIDCRTVGEEWIPVEGQFLRLKFLGILSSNLVHWRANETHFPCLEHLVLEDLMILQEIPSEIGDISTLQSIKLVRCSSSAVNSANKILEEQHELGNEDLQLWVR